MNRKQIEEYKRNRWQYEYDRRNVAQTIQGLSPECKGVEIEIKLSFLSAICKSEKEFKVSLSSTDKAYWHHDCLNRDCTGHGFSLTNEIYSAIASRQTREGTIRCDGKEDWKYYANTGCSCNSSCQYRIAPLF